MVREIGKGLEKSGNLKVNSYSILKKIFKGKWMDG